MTIDKDTPVAPIFNQSFSLTSPTADSQEYPYGKESLYRDCIAEVMRADGWSVLTEVRTELGVADLVARRGAETWVIEAKLFGDTNSIAHACGQLLFYTVDLPFAERIVAVPERLPFRLNKALGIHGVGLFESTAYYQQVNSLFDKESELKKQNDAIQKYLLAIQELMMFLESAGPIKDQEIVRQWRGLADVLEETSAAIRIFVEKGNKNQEFKDSIKKILATTAVRQYSGDSKPALSVIRGDAA